MRLGISVSYGDPSTFRALVYGTNKDPTTVRYLEDQVNNIATNFSNVLTDAGRSFMDNAVNIYEKFNGSAAMEATRRALRKAGSAFKKNEIQFINTVAGFQTAPLVMQRFIMAEPTVRRMYQHQQCDGFSNTYVDMHPGAIGENHYDYRRVMHGMLTETEDGGDRFTYYLDELAEGDRELLFSEQVDILDSWAVVSRLMRFGEDDPTSDIGGKL